jgi:hypothetical protein
MDEPLAKSPIQGTPPRLWVERLVLFRTIDPVDIIRDVRLRRGVNIVWAHEPRKPPQGSGLRTTGHGVGKTSFCLLLRYCLGDDTKTIDALREEVRLHFPHGGVGAVIHMDGRVFSVFRHFAPHHEGVTAETENLEALLTADGRVPYREFESLLSETMLSRLNPRTIPDTGQPILWRHLLAWLARDQGTRFGAFFQWREGEGTGLQRPRQDPPLLMRAALGLLDGGETDVLQRVHVLEQQVESAQKEVSRLEQEPNLIRRRIESNLRAWFGADEDMPVRSDDLFNKSIATRLSARRGKAGETVASIDAEIEEIENQLAVLREEQLREQREHDYWDNEFQLAEAARNRDENALRRCTQRRNDLLKLAGLCEHGGVLFQECSYIEKRITTMSFEDGRDQAALNTAISQLAANAVSSNERRQTSATKVEEVQQRVDDKKHTRRQLQIKRDTTLHEKQRGDNLWDELSRWEQSEGTPEDTQSLERARSHHEDLKRDLGSARTRLVILQQDKSDREKRLSELTDRLARELLSDEIFASFESRDESRPFRLSLRGGEAHRVLEVLLGDVVCIRDAATAGSAIPAFLLHDCPREADMSSRLYADYLLQLAVMEEQLTPKGGGAPFQYILTTTTPPPSSLQHQPFLRLKLDPSADDKLFFKARFGTSQHALTD